MDEAQGNEPQPSDELQELLTADPEYLIWLDYVSNDWQFDWEREQPIGDME